MVQINKSETTINGRAFELADYVVEGLSMDARNEEDLAMTLGEMEQIFEEDRIEYELEVLENLGYNYDMLSSKEIEKIVWGK